MFSAARTLTPALAQAFPAAHVITDTAEVSVADGPAVARAAQAAGATAIITPYETGLPAGAYARTVLGLPGTPVTSAVAASDKLIMKRRFRAAGLPIMPFRVVHSPQQLRAWAEDRDVVAKPLFGGGSAGVYRIGAELPDYRYPVLCEDAASVLAEYHVDGIVDDGQFWAAVSRYHEPMLTSARAQRPYSSTTIDPADSGEALELARRAVAAVRLRASVFHLELFATPSGWVVSEIACRPAGGGIPRALQLAYGVDLVRASWQFDCGQRPEWQPHEYRPIAHLALPATITEEQRARLAALPGHLETTRAAAGPGFYSATNAGCCYVDPGAIDAARALLEDA
ncbi:hypothetical protein C1Y63_04010 [Corynebacterium sp. 13CS0277]|nr:hypothetical protein C1Y63_04010 [Corynebacterium sp. 13CS0277]